MGMSADLIGSAPDWEPEKQPVCQHSPEDECWSLPTSPTGSGSVVDQRYGGIPPAAIRASVTGVPTCATSSLELVMVKGLRMATVNRAEAVWLLLSVTVRAQEKVPASEALPDRRPIGEIARPAGSWPWVSAHA